MGTRAYSGRRTPDGAVVETAGKLLDPRLDLWRHSPDGFEWGYGGSGPAQLALALLADVLEDDDEAIRLHQDFKWAVVAKLPHQGWRLDSDEVRATALRLAAGLEIKEEDRG